MTSRNHINHPPLDPTELFRFIEELGSRQLKADSERVRELLDGLPLDQRTRAVTRFHGKHRLDMLLVSSQARELVQSLPAPEFWITVKEVGEEDAIELFKLASPEQIQHILDLEWWHRDALDPLAATYWLMLLNEAGPETVVAWFRQADEELLISVFSRFFTVHRPDPDNQGFEPWRSFKNLWTLDDAYYLHFKEDRLAPTIERTLAAIRAEEPMRYYGLLDAIDALLLNEQEEGAYRLRNSRLENYGFIEFEEAVEIYRPLSDRELEELEREAGEPAPAGRPDFAPEYPLALQDPPPLFRQALAEIDRLETWQDICLAMAALTNRLLIADGMDLSRLESLHEALKKAQTFVEIGLVRWSRGELERAVKLLNTQHIFSLFRAGYTRLLSLARRADRLKREGWLARVGFWRELTGEEGPVLAGLLFTRPRCFSGVDEKGEPVYREFRSDAEVTRAELALERTAFLGELFFEALRLVPSEFDLLRERRRFASPLSFEAVFLTALVNSLVGRGFSFSPLSRDEAGKGLSRLLNEEQPARTRDGVRVEAEALVDRSLSRLPGFDERRRGLAREFLARAFLRLEEELGAVNLDSLDPRYISALVIE